MAKRRLVVTGRVGKDAEVLTNRATGEQFIAFTVCTNTKVKDKEIELWTDIVSSLVNLAPHIKKGTYIDVEGSPQVKVWVDKEGKPAGKLVCNAFAIDPIGGSNADKPINESAPVAAVVGGDEPAPTQEFTC